MCWRTAASISSRTTPRLWSPERRQRDAAHLETTRLEIPLGVRLLESIASLYFETGRDGAPDGGDPARRDRLLYTIAGFRAAAGRLSHDSSADFLSGSKPVCGGNDGDRAIGAAVRPASGFESDDIKQFRRVFCRRAAVQPESEY